MIREQFRVLVYDLGRASGEFVLLDGRDMFAGGVVLQHFFIVITGIWISAGMMKLNHLFLPLAR